MGREMNRYDLTETELEQVLRSSRFSSKEHKKDLYERIFGKKDNGLREENLQKQAWIPALSMEELEMVAGGRTLETVIHREDGLDP